MNKTLNFTIIRVVFLAVVGTALSAGLLRAENYKGSFTLPVEVRWGKAILPAGEYTFTIDTENGPNLATVRGDHAAAMIVANGKSNRQFSGRVRWFWLAGDAPESSGNCTLPSPALNPCTAGKEFVSMIAEPWFQALKLRPQTKGESR